MPKTQLEINKAIGRIGIIGVDMKSYMKVRLFFEKTNLAAIGGDKDAGELIKILSQFDKLLQIINSEG